MMLPRARAADLVGLLAWILAAVVLGVLRLLRVRHDWGLGEMSGLMVGVIVGVPFALLFYGGLFLMTYNWLLRSLFPALPEIRLPWWPPASGG
jgi:hypothetical protein